jgi:hypothetical protein
MRGQEMGVPIGAAACSRRPHHAPVPPLETALSPRLRPGQSAYSPAVHRSPVSRVVHPVVQRIFPGAGRFPGGRAG